MATRQTAGKSGKRGTAPAGRKTAASATRPGSTSKAATGSPNGKPARSGQAARKSQPARPESRPMVQRVLGAVAGGLGPAVRWSGGGLAFTTIVVSLLGLADAVYLTYQHFSGATSFVGCSASGAVNCEAVTTSPESHVFGIPVAVLGLAFFVFMVAINSRWGWKAPWPAVHWARLASVVIGIVFVLYLIWAELFRINAICLYCTGVHIFTFILFALIIGRAAFSGVKAITDND
ncbi:MAG TPA: vitamin K epoxide reductase family protein [Streptosporangiaceae bacterium]|jgi:uncharacterized membrane protein|nr:vitamin K epoxide reductase family protein [Streptosporangiaceae bacterium]